MTWASRQTPCVLCGISPSHAHVHSTTGKICTSVSLRRGGPRRLDVTAPSVATLKSKPSSRTPHEPGHFVCKGNARERKRTPGRSHFGPAFQEQLRTSRFLRSVFRICCCHPRFPFLSWHQEPAIPVYPVPYSHSRAHSCPPDLLISSCCTTCSPGIYYYLDFSPDASPRLCSVYPLRDLTEVLSMIHHLQISFGYLGIAFYIYLLFT